MKKKNSLKTLTLALLGLSLSQGAGYTQVPPPPPGPTQPMCQCSCFTNFTPTTTTKSRTTTKKNVVLSLDEGAAECIAACTPADWTNIENVQWNFVCYGPPLTPPTRK